MVLHFAYPSKFFIQTSIFVGPPNPLQTWVLPCFFSYFSFLFLSPLGASPCDATLTSPSCISPGSASPWDIASHLALLHLPYGASPLAAHLPAPKKGKPPPARRRSRPRKPAPGRGANTKKATRQGRREERRRDTAELSPSPWTLPSQASCRTLATSQVVRALLNRRCLRRSIVQPLHCIPSQKGLLLSRFLSRRHLLPATACTIDKKNLAGGPTLCSFLATHLHVALTRQASLSPIPQLATDLTMRHRRQGCPQLCIIPRTRLRRLHLHSNAGIC